MAHAPDTSIGPQGSPAGTTAPGQGKPRPATGEPSFGYDDERSPAGTQPGPRTGAVPPKPEEPQTQRERRGQNDRAR